MAWLNLNSYERQEYVELRLNAPKAEKILLEFNIGCKSTSFLSDKQIILQENDKL